MALAIVASIAYLAFRALYTLNFDGWFAGTFSLTLYAAEAYGCGMMFLYFFQIWDLRDPAPVPPLEGRTVDVMIPTYNEDPDLLRGTITAALAMSYPHRTLVLDDGDRQEVRELCAELGAEWVRRDSNLHAKAGNINHAMERTDGEFVIILDADHVSESHFIDRVLGYFADEKLAFVQTPHAFYNYDSFQGVLDYRKGLYWEEGQLFYNCTQPGKNRWNGVSFCGSAAMFRRAALEDVGLVATESITEDLHTGLRLHSKGWNSLFVNERLISGQAAPDLATFHTQRLRWGEGNLGVAFFDNPLTMPGLTLAQRLCYIGSMACWTTGVQKLALYYAPIVMLATGVAPVSKLTPTLLGVTTAYLISVWAGVKLASGGYGKLIAIEMTAMACYWTQVKSVWRATFGRAAAKFVVTSKRGGAKKGVLGVLKPQLLLIAAGGAATAWAGAKLITGVSEDYTGFAIGALLCGVNSVFAAEVVRRALRSGDQRYSWRHPVAAHLGWTAQDEQGAEQAGAGVTRDLNERGAGFVTFGPIPGADGQPAGPGSRITVTVSAAGRSATLPAEVRWTRREAEPGGRNQPGAHRYGVLFDEAGLTTAALDVLWDLSAKYGVARQYERFGDRAGAIGGICVRATGEERVMNLPASVRFLSDGAAGGGDDAPGDREGLDLTDPALPAPEHAVTETAGPDTIGLLLAAAHAPGSVAAVELGTPAGPARAWAAVAETWPVKVGGRTLHAHRLRLRKFAGEGRGVLRGVVHKANDAALRDVVKLVPEKTPVPAARPAAAVGAAAGLAAAVLLAAGVLFHADDWLMTHTARVAEATPGQVLRLEAIADDMRAAPDDAAVDEARVLRLRRAFTALGEDDDVAGLNELLVRLSPETPEGRFRRAESLLNLGRTAEAETAFRALLADLDAFDEPRARQDVCVAAARCAAHAGAPAAGAERFERAVAQGLPLRPIRTEWAGLLAESGQSAKAVRVLTFARPAADGNPDVLRRFPPADRRLLAPLHLALGETEAAAAVYRSLLADDPADADAALGLARVALEAGADGATDAFRLFLAKHPDDPAARLGFAQALIAEGEPAAAEAALRDLLSENAAHPEVWGTYLALLDEPAAGSGQDAVPLDAPRRAIVRAIAAARGLRPGDGDLRLQLIGAVRRFPEPAAAAATGRPTADAGSPAAPTVRPWDLLADAEASADEAEAVPAAAAASRDELLTALREEFAALPADTAARRLRRAEALADLGRTDEADALLETLCETLAADPAVLPDERDRALAWAAGARAAVRAGRPVPAARRFARAVAAGLDPADVRGERAGVIAALGYPADARAVLTAGLPPAGVQPAPPTADAPFAPPLRAGERLQLGGLHLACGDAADAVAVLAPLVAERPADLSAVRLLADAERDAGFFLPAAERFAAAVALDPAADRADGDRLRLAAARCRVNGGDFAGAERTFRSLLSADKNRAELWPEYLALLAPAAGGTARVRADEPQRAVVGAILARRERFTPDEYTDEGAFLLTLAAAADAAGLPAAEVRGVRQRFADRPAFAPLAKLRRAEALADLGRHEEAAAALDELLLDPAALPTGADRVRLHLAAARSAVRFERWELAGQRFDAALAAGAGPAALRSERAGVLTELGDPAAALALFAGADVRTLTVPERIQLAGLHLATGDAAAGAAALEAVTGERPDDPAAWRTLGDVRAAAGEFLPAAIAYETALKLAPAANDAEGVIDRDRLATAAAFHRFWGNDSVGAEAAFRRLLTETPDRPALFPPYLAVLAVPTDRVDLRFPHHPPTEGTDDGLGPRPAGEDGADPAADDDEPLPDRGRVPVRAAQRALVETIADRRDSRPGDRRFLLRLIAVLRHGGGETRVGDAVSVSPRLRAVRVEFVALPVENPVQRLRRAEVLADLGRIGEAAAEVEAVWATHAADPAALPRKADRVRLALAAARAAATAGRPGDAAERFAAAARLGAEPHWFRAERAAALADLGRPGDGADVLRADLARGFDPAPPLDRGERFQLAGLLADADRLEASADVLTALAEDFPADRRAALMLADVLTGLDRFLPAARQYERAVRLDPAADRADGDRARIAAARCLAWGGRVAAAEAAFRPLLTADMNRTELWTPYLEAVGGLPTVPRAAEPLIAELWRRRGERADDERFLLTLTLAAKQSGDDERVIELLRTLTASPHTPAERLRWLAAALDARGDHEEAARVYARLLRTTRGAAAGGTPRR